MTITNLSGREFEKHIGRAKKAAKDGPVFISHRGKSAYVFLSIEKCRQLTAERGKSSASGNSKMSIIALLGMPSGIEDVEVEFPRADFRLRPADFD